MTVSGSGRINLAELLVFNRADLFFCQVLVKFLHGLLSPVRIGAPGSSGLLLQGFLLSGVRWLRRLTAHNH